jgi:2-hydroxy-3-keto-5-methylthiopentenyl-1-phosphate phosphatase
MPEPAARAGFRVFIDFDNTITIGDVLDGVIEKFSADDRWRALETDWETGRIGARECLDGQLRGLRATWPEFECHLEGVALDSGFAALIEFVRREGGDLMIVSDNFDLFVGHILQRRGLAHLTVRANHLELAGDRVIPSFPFGNPNCPGCAHCKKTHFIPPNADGRRVVYIGDGRSDLCPARHADVVFAKSGLLAQLRAEKVPCIAFDDLADVVRRLQNLLHENKL